MLTFIIIGCQEKDTTNKDIPLKYKIDIEINKNVETIGIILNLTDRSARLLEISSEENFFFVKSFRKRFIEYQDHPTVALVNELEKQNLFGIYRPYFGLNYTELPSFQKKSIEKTMFDENSDYTKQQLDSIYNGLANAIRQFYIDVDLETFFNKHQELYNKVEKEVELTIISPYIIDSLSHFSGSKVDNIKFSITPSLTMFEGWGFGYSIKENDSLKYYQLLSHFGGNQPNLFEPLSPEDTLGFNDVNTNFEFTIHEFGHSFVDFLREDSSSVQLIKQVEHLFFKNLQDKIESIGYGSKWEQCFEEHLVRATEVMMLNKFGKKDLIKEKMIDEVEQYGFVYLPVFVDELKKYEANRSKYSSLQEYLPVLIESLSKIDTTEYLF